jgi:hypothetical protein
MWTHRGQIMLFLSFIYLKHILDDFIISPDYICSKLKWGPYAQWKH